MISFRDIIENISNNTSFHEYKLSEYYQLFGYFNKHSFLRYLKTLDYKLITREEKINVRKGKEFYICQKDLINLINEHFADVPDWENMYIEYLKERFDRKVFTFRTTDTKEYRYKLGNSIYVKGSFYDYSLNTKDFAYEIGICPYECFKIAHKRFHPSFGMLHFSGDERIPMVCFDCLDAKIRNCFLSFIDLIEKEIKMDSIQLLLLKAYRISIREMLNYQQQIDNKNLKRVRNREKTTENRLKKIYREASKYFHPDVNDSPEADSIMKKVNEFYEKKDYHSIKNLLDIKSHSV